ncbi:SpoIIIAH-like family protein [Evansella sp. LMS18]|jgi:stage III sporulation protein AH|uniref:SpoIIIAH-like family protein n=1 Tax=Evansella sp. LMS18 TaxID=2924033 RepID=UPI0020D10412|nr:SpoIIIAH-like family protein [Evansella sp. LMS18]UTR09467.1 SpoIIIAH-like family protein [Evansella sp. LMS18]
MVLKRQTVWLLTMLSLIVVLSVYYISMENMQPEEAMTGLHEEADSEGNSDSAGEFGPVDEDVTFIELEEVEDVLGESSLLTGMAAEEVFNTIRLQRMDARERLSEEYVNVFLSDESDTEVQVQALDKYEELRTLSQKEEMLETLIRSKGYDDALVIVEENDVKIYVKADDLSKSEAAELNKMAYEQLGDKNVRVGFQSGK